MSESLECRGDTGKELPWRTDLLCPPFPQPRALLLS